MTEAQILLLIEIATQLAQIIDGAVTANSSAQLQSAWAQAKADFAEGLQDTAS